MFLETPSERLQCPDNHVLCNTLPITSNRKPTDWQEKLLQPHFTKMQCSSGSFIICALSWVLPKLSGSRFIPLLFLSYILSFFRLKFSFARSKGQYFVFWDYFASFFVIRPNSTAFCKCGLTQLKQRIIFLFNPVSSSSLVEFFLQVSIFRPCYFLHNFLVQNLQLARSEIFVGFVQTETFTRTKVVFREQTPDSCSLKSTCFNTSSWVLNVRFSRRGSISKLCHFFTRFAPSSFANCCITASLAGL